MANGAGWRPDPDPELDDEEVVDPEHSGQERSWDESSWTDRVRPAGSAGPADDGASDHVPQLHRAMSAAAADLDAVDDRISTLFERAEGSRPGGTAPRVRAGAGAGAAGAGATTTGVPASEAKAVDDDDVDNEDADFIALFEDEDVVAAATGEEVGEDVVVVSRLEILSEYQEMTSGTFPELDAELAGEEPDQLRARTAKRRMFRRRGKGTGAFQR
jgi:hypothetical protein